MGYFDDISHAILNFIWRQTIQSSQTQQDMQDEFYLKGSEDNHSLSNHQSREQ
jgi:hypothetical protein